MRHARINTAIILLGAGILLNVIILAQGDTSAGWPILAIILLTGAGISLLAERREP